MKNYYIIAAASMNNVIGKNGKIPWHLKNDLLRFKRITEYSPIIMGRKTYETFPRPLPNRLHIVISSKELRLRSDHVVRVASLDEAFDVAEKTISKNNSAYVIGGGQIYSQTISDPRISGILLTRVKVNIEDGDAFFPEISPVDWKRCISSHHLCDDFNDHNSMFEIYLRKNIDQTKIREITI